MDVTQIIIIIIMGIIIIGLLYQAYDMFKPTTVSEPTLSMSGGKWKKLRKYKK